MSTMDDTFTLFAYRCSTRRIAYNDNDMHAFSVSAKSLTHGIKMTRFLRSPGCPPVNRCSDFFLEFLLRVGVVNRDRSWWDEVRGPHGQVARPEEPRAAVGVF